MKTNISLLLTALSLVMVSFLTYREIRRPVGPPGPPPDPRDRMAFGPDRPGMPPDRPGMPPRPPDHRGPPPEAFKACEGKSPGAPAEFVNPRGETVKGKCEDKDGKLVLRPDFLRRDEGAPPPDRPEEDRGDREK
jgi:hypothetical protein